MKEYMSNMILYITESKNHYLAATTLIRLFSTDYVKQIQFNKQYVNITPESLCLSINTTDDQDAPYLFEEYKEQLVQLQGQLQPQLQQLQGQLQQLQPQQIDQIQQLQQQLDQLQDQL